MKSVSSIKHRLPFRVFVNLKCMLGFTLGGCLCLSAFAAAPPAETVHPQVDRDFGKLPMSFEPNHGQTDAPVQFLSRGRGYSLYLTPGEAVLRLNKGDRSSALGMKLVGANTNASGAGVGVLPGTVNYFEGKDPAKWQTDLPTYKSVAYKSIYPGVDVVYYGHQRDLEYDFVLAPGADANRIALSFTGAQPHVDAATGDLVLPIAESETHFHKPVVYQIEGSRKLEIAANYIVADGQVRFALGQYDHSKTLVIDPVLSYLTYLGGTSDDEIHGVAVDSKGNVIVVGTTYSADYPLKNAYSSVPPADYRTSTMFISKFNATGTALVYSTYLGVSTQGNAIAVDPSGNAYVFGTTNDPNYPVTAGAFQTICGANNNNLGQRVTGCSATVVSGNNSTVLSKISPDGSQLVYSTFFSGTNGNIAEAIAVNSAGEAYITGLSNAVCPGPYNSNGTGYQAYFCIPVTSNAAEPANNSGANADTYAFITKFNAQGTGLLYSTLLGNHNSEGHYVSGIHSTAIALDSAGNAYITGYMDGNYFIKTTAGALQTSRPNAQSPAFVVKYDPTGTSSTSLAYSTYLSGTGNSTDYANAIAVDASGDAIVTGVTNSCTFPTTAGTFSNVPNGYLSDNNCNGGFLSKLNATGSSLVWSTWTSNLGANGRVNDANDALALAADGSVYLAGDSNSSPLYPAVNPIFVQSESHFTYLKHFTADGKSLVFSSAIGGTTDATSLPSGVALDASGNIYIAGYTNSLTWPTTPGVFQAANKKTNGGSYTGYVVKLAPTATTTTVLTLPAGTVTAGQSAKFTAKVTGPTGATVTPTGTVSFFSGSTLLGTGTLDSTGTATYTAASLNATTYNVTANYAGDTAFASSVSVAQSLVVTPAASIVTLTAPATATVGASITLGVTVTGTAGTPTGMITFKDGATSLGTATLASGLVSFSTKTLTAGAHKITASYGGDSIFGSAVSAASTVTISLTAPTVTLTAPSTALVGASVKLSVVVAGSGGSPTGTVTFKDGAATLGTMALASGTASYTTTALALGTHTITASYSGDSLFGAAVSAASTVTIGVPAAISFAAKPASLTIAHGASGSVVITGTAVGGYTGTVTFACGALPTSANCTFAPASLSFTPSAATQTTTLTLTTSTTTNASLERSALGLSSILAALLMFPMGRSLRGRKGRAGSFLLFSFLVLGAFGALGLSGCGGSSSPKTTTTTTPAGTYTVPVTVATASGNTTLNISLTVQ